MVDYVGNAIPAPSFSKGTVFSTDEELQYSTRGFSQKGATLKAGQGVVLIGTVLARETTTKKYVRFASGGSNGTGTPVGILRRSVDTGTDAAGKEYQGNIVIAGILKYQAISTANSTQLGAAVTALNARTDTTLGLFTF